MRKSFNGVRISVDFENTPLDEAIFQLGEKSGLKFNYNAKLFPKDANVTYQFGNAALADILDSILPSNVTYKAVRNIVILRGATKEETLEFIPMDLEEAAQELPIVGNESNGRIYKAAAYHLLAEVYISLGMETVDASFYGMAVDAASTIINGEVGDYQLMTERFGDLSREGDVFSDLFWTNQQYRSSGNVV